MPTPDDLPRSPTGRIPQWVIDEAAGRARPAEPWRAPSTPMEIASPAGPPRSRRRQNLIAIVVILVVFGSPRLLESGLLSRWLPTQQTGSDLVSQVQADGSIVLLSRDEAWPTPDVAAQPSRLLPEVSAPDGSFSIFPGNGVQPARWSPCRTIPIVVNTQGAPKGFYRVLGQVIAELQGLTGLSLVLEGVSDEPVSSSRQGFQPDRYGDRWAPVLVGWSDETRLPGLAGTVVGLGSPYAVSGNDGQHFYVSGTAMLDTSMLGEVMADGGPVYVAVLRHELGHVLGLDHTGDAQQLMAAELGTTSDFADGDRAGLAYLGSGPCSSGI